MSRPLCGPPYVLGPLYVYVLTLLYTLGPLYVAGPLDALRRAVGGYHLGTVL